MAETYEKIVSIKFQSDQAIRGIQQLNASIEQNTKELKKLANEGQKGTEEYARLEQQTKSLKKQKQELSRVVQNELTMQRTQLESVQKLRAELSFLTQQYDKLSAEQRVNVNVGVKLKDQINQVTNEIKKAEEGTQRYYRNVGNYQNAILGALGVNNSFVGSLVSMGASGEDAGNALDGMGGDAVRTTSAMATLNVHAKALGKTLISLAKNPFFVAVAAFVGVGAAAKWFYEYNVEVEKAMRLTREFTGVAGSELVHLRAEIQATASTYGKEYKEVLESVDLLMSHFHLSSEQAIRTLNDGFMIGADINGNYLQLLKQYAPVFKDAGISAEQLVALIQQTRSGIFSQQGLEAIKQASARIREMSKGTRSALQGIGIDVDELQRKLRTKEIEMVDAIKMVTDKLKEVGGNTEEYGDVMANVFGKQGKFSSQEMIESLGDIDTNLQHLKDSAGEYGKAMEDNQKATADLEEETAKLFGVGENGWETLKTRADTYWKEALANAIKRTRDLIGRFAEMGRKSVVFRQAAQIIAGVVWSLTGSIIDSFRAVGAGFKAVGSWLDAFVTTFKSAFKIIQNLAIGVGDILTGNITKGLAEIGNGLRTGIQNTLKGITTALNDTVNVARAATTGFRNMYSTVGQFFDKYQPIDDDNFSYSTDPEELLEDTNTQDSPSGDKKKGKTKKSPSTKKTTQKKTGKTDAEKEAERIAKERLKVAQQLVNEAEKLQKKADDEMAKISRESIAVIFQKRIEELNKQYEFVISITKEQEAKLTEEERKVLVEARTTYGVLLKGIEDERKKAYDNFDAQQAKERAERLKKAKELAKTYADNMLATTKDGTKQWLDAYLRTLDIAQQEELRNFDANNQLKANNLTQWLETRNSIEAKYEKLRLDAQKTLAQHELEVQQSKYNAIASMVGGLGDVLGAFGEEQKEWLVLQKTLALGEIMISQAVAIANAIKNASQGSITVWDMIAQIATGVTAVTTAMVQAFTALDGAKFATGGYIQGAGTGTSDSIPVRVSNGESIMNANTTAMFGGLLSSLNQLGGGVPIQVQQTASSVRGEDMLARAVARGVAMLPAPVVSVEDINRGQRQVQVLNDRATL